MHRPGQCTIEAHVSAATLYLSGTVSVRGLLDAMARAEQLPESIWTLRVCTAAAAPLDDGTATVLAHLLRRWSERRAGITVIVPGGMSPRRVVPALGCRTLLRTMTRRNTPVRGA